MLVCEFYLAQIRSEAKYYMLRKFILPLHTRGCVRTVRTSSSCMLLAASMMVYDNQDKSSVLFLCFVNEYYFLQRAIPIGKGLEQ